MAPRKPERPGNAYCDANRLAVPASRGREVSGERKRFAGRKGKRVARVGSACGRLPRIAHRAAHSPLAQVDDVELCGGGLGEAYRGGHTSLCSDTLRRGCDPDVDGNESCDAQHPVPSDVAVLRQILNTRDRAVVKGAHRHGLPAEKRRDGAGPGADPSGCEARFENRRHHPRWSTMCR